MLLLLEVCSPFFTSEPFSFRIGSEVLLVSHLLDDTKFLAFLGESFDKPFHALAFARLHLIVGSHYFPFANFDQIAELDPKAEISTPGSFGDTPSRAFEPWGEPADLPLSLLDIGVVPSNRSTPLYESRPTESRIFRLRSFLFRSSNS